MLDTSTLVESSDLHLSLLRPSPRSRQARLDLRAPYEMHRTLSRAFPPAANLTPAEDSDYKSARCLFRVDETKTGLCLIVQSRIAPAWDSLPTDYLSEPVQEKVWRPKFSQGQKLTFRLRANPTVCREKKRIPLRTEAECEAWLERKIREAGVILIRATIASEGPIRSTIERGQSTVHHAVRFEGTLQVTDPDKLAAAVAAGIGPAKGFGFGLLSLARAA